MQVLGAVGIFVSSKENLNGGERCGCLIWHDEAQLRVHVKLLKNKCSLERGG